MYLRRYRISRRSGYIKQAGRDIGRFASTGNREMIMPVTNCVAHCSACGAHFTGLSPFDAHRVEGACVSDLAGLMRPVRGGEMIQALQPFTEAGVCWLSPGCVVDGKRALPNSPVTIWQVWQSPVIQARLEKLLRERNLTRAAERSAATPPSGSELSSKPTAG
jgi:hypothetical protein